MLWTWADGENDLNLPKPKYTLAFHRHRRFLGLVSQKLYSKLETRNNAVKHGLLCCYFFFLFSLAFVRWNRRGQVFFWIMSQFAFIHSDCISWHVDDMPWSNLILPKQYAHMRECVWSANVTFYAELCFLFCGFIDSAGILPQAHSLLSPVIKLKPVYIFCSRSFALSSFYKGIHKCERVNLNRLAEIFNPWIECRKRADRLTETHGCLQVHTYTHSVCGCVIRWLLEKLLTTYNFFSSSVSFRKC